MRGIAHRTSKVLFGGQQAPGSTTVAALNPAHWAPAGSVDVPDRRHPAAGEPCAARGRRFSCDQLPYVIIFTCPAGNGISALADCQVDCQPLELPLFSSDGGGRVQAADLLKWTAVDRPGQAGKSYESASPRSARPTATATAAEPAPGSAGRSHRPRRTTSAGPEPHLLAFDRRQSDNVGDIPRSGRCLPIRTCRAAALDSAAQPRISPDFGSSGRGGRTRKP